MKMVDKTRTLVDQIVDGNNVEAGENFKSVMQDCLLEVVHQGFYKLGFFYFHSHLCLAHHQLKRNLMHSKELELDY